jgi:hypothetical protein
MIKTRTEITLETDRLLVVSSRKRFAAWCDSCQTNVEMTSVDEAALLGGITSRTLFHWVEAGQVHAGETANGLLLICLNSLLSGGPAEAKPNGDSENAWSISQRILIKTAKGAERFFRRLRR